MDWKADLRAARAELELAPPGASEVGVGLLGRLDGECRARDFAAGRVLATGTSELELDRSGFYGYVPHSFYDGLLAR